MLNRCSARARSQPTPGAMNKTEQAYRDYLELHKRDGLIREYRFEAVKLRLANRTFYTPDFMVITNDNTIELHEVKGFWEDDARVKIKVAAEQHWWFKFVAIQKKGGGWKVEEF